MEPEKINLIGQTQEELEAFVASIGEAKFRGRQLFSWIYQKHVESFAEMSNLARSFQAKLADLATLAVLKKVHSLNSAQSGTIKYLFELNDGHRIESVFMPEADRRTLCVSSQVGCPLSCTFCATGKMGYRRNLTVAEIIDQVIQVERELGTELTNIVFMGMGEPMLNYDNVIKACALLSHPDGIAIGQRHIVISTAGWVPGLKRYADEGHRYKVAISLHATTDAVRKQLMPVASRFSIPEIMAMARYYAKKSRRRITFEYLLIHDVNDSFEDAHRLRAMLKDIPCKVNLIPLNAVNETLKQPPIEYVDLFAQQMYPLTAPVTVRWSKGDDIQGACGQLAAKENQVSSI